MSRKSDSVRRRLSQSRCGLSTLGICQPGRGKRARARFLSSHQIGNEFGVPPSPLSCCCCRLSQKSKERPSVSDIEPEPNKQPPTQSHNNNQPPTHLCRASISILSPPLPPLPWAPSCTLCIIDGNFKTCLKNFTHLPDLQFVCFVLLCVRLTLILMDQTYGKATERDPTPSPCSLPGTGANVLII